MTAAPQLPTTAQTPAQTMIQTMPPPIDRTTARTLATTSPITTSVTLCGRLGDPAGPVVDVSLPAAGCTAIDLRARVAAAFPVLAPDLSGDLADVLDRVRVRVCVDDAIVADDYWVMPGQAVALFPPVSGG